METLKRTWATLLWKKGFIKSCLTSRRCLPLWHFANPFPKKNPCLLANKKQSLSNILTSFRAWLLLVWQVAVESSCFIVQKYMMLFCYVDVVVNDIVVVFAVAVAVATSDVILLFLCVVLWRCTIVLQLNTQRYQQTKHC